jgi:hypothetical protein
MITAGTDLASAQLRRNQEAPLKRSRTSAATRLEAG